MVRDTLVRGHS